MQINHNNQLQKRGSVNENQSERRVKKNKLLRARENVSHQITVGFCFESNWWRYWREFSGPITPGGFRLAYSSDFATPDQKRQ